MSSLPARSALSKSSGFHRIRDRRTAERIIASTGLAPPDLAIEFGAGEGQLTSAVAARVRKVLAVEFDRQRWRALRQRFAECPSVEPVLADFMAFELPQRTPYKLVSNVPFGLTARLLRRLVALERPPVAAYLILQTEAAQKWAGIGHETAASLLLKSRFEARPLLALHRSSFSPRPDVDAVLIELALRSRPLVAPRELAHFEAFLRQGFGGSRFRQNRRGELTAEDWADAFRQRRLSTTARARR